MAPMRNRRSAHLANVAGQLLTAKNKSIGPKVILRILFIITIRYRYTR